MNEEKDVRRPRDSDRGGRRREKVWSEEVTIWLVTLVTAVAVASGSAAVDATFMPTRSAGQFRSLVWAAVGEHSTVEVPGCTATLLHPQWALLAARCVPPGSENQLVLHAPRSEDDATPEEEGNRPEARKQWAQQRRVVEVVMAPNEDTEKGAAPYPAVALVRTESPFALGALQPASLLWGILDDPRRPLRCSVAGWDIVGDEKKPSSTYPSDLTWTAIGKVMTYSQCAAFEGLVERDSQFCVEVAVPAPGLQDTMAALGEFFNSTDEAMKKVQRTGLIGNPLLCAGALVGVRYLRSGLPGLSTTRDPNASVHYRVDVFTNATYLEPWIRQHVKDIKVISTDGGLVVVPDSATHAPSWTRRSHGPRYFGHSDATSTSHGDMRVWMWVLATCLAATL